MRPLLRPTWLILAGCAWVWAVASVAARVEGAWAPGLYGLLLLAMSGLWVSRASDRVAIAFATFVVPGVLGFWLLSTGSEPGVFSGSVIGLSSIGLALLLTRARERPIRWLILLGSATLAVAFASSSAGGASPMIEALQRWLGLSDVGAYWLTFAIRKGVHFAFYAFVAFTALRSAARLPRPYLFALEYALALAVFDEGRQSFLVERTGQIDDVALDTAGAGVALWLCSRRRKDVSS